MSDQTLNPDQQAADLASIEGQMDAIELAAAVTDGGIQACELTDDQVRILLSARSAEVVAELLSGRCLEPSESESPSPYVLANYLRKWTPAIGSLAVAAALAIVAIIGLQPSPGLNWSTPANIASLPALKGKDLGSDRPLMKFLDGSDSRLVVIDSFVHTSGTATSFGIVSLNDKGLLSPHAIVTFWSSQRTGADRPTGKAILGATWIDQMCASGFDVFAATTAEGDACWGTIEEDCSNKIVGIWRPAARVWTLSDPAAPSSPPEPGLKAAHRSAFRGSPFSQTEAWDNK